MADYLWSEFKKKNKRVGERNMFEEIRPLQLKQLQILKEFKKVCDTNNLTYFLGFGTLLGSIRHDGFIPWDDDVDVCMNYKDYVALDEACKKDLADDYFLQSSESDPASHMTFKKMRLNSTTLIHKDYAHRDMNHGIAIDIYPVFHAANDEKARQKQVRCATLYLLLVVGEPPKNHGKVLRLGGSVLLGILRGKLGEKVKQYCFSEMTKYENIDTKYRAMFYGNINNCRRIYPAKYFEGTVLHRFEDDYFSVPEKYDEYLTFRYGDYMKMPPIEEQGVKLENQIKIDTENSYLKYKGIYYCVK